MSHIAKNTGRSHRKTSVMVVAGLLVVASAGTAYAYWTAGGTGTGTATTQTTALLTVNQTSSITTMHPGDSAQTLSGTFNNATGAPVYVTHVVVSIASVVKAGGAPAGTCGAADYDLLLATMDVAATVPVGTSVGSWTGATIQFKNDTGANQDGCKGATVNLAYAVD